MTFGAQPTETISTPLSVAEDWKWFSKSTNSYTTVSAKTWMQARALACVKLGVSRDDIECVASPFIKAVDNG